MLKSGRLARRGQEDALWIIRGYEGGSEAYEYERKENYNPDPKHCPGKASPLLDKQIKEPPH